MHENPERTTPIGLARYAHEFYGAAKAVEVQSATENPRKLIPSIPSLYLIGHSIELGLKSYLLNKGVQLRELRSKKYGHDLHACHRKAKELGLLSHVKFKPEEEGAMELLNQLYSTKQLEYIVTGAKALPIFEQVESFARTLINGVSIQVGYKALCGE
ncbi:hypothetical protein [Pseudomonas subflava]|uniref:hypothetical protein n=1 Tax=Pseudomonas subflava TaxID=2952933 RepID=UPI002079D3B6|nr:hypothetical protein [Pseudomonas subflava]